MCDGEAEVSKPASCTRSRPCQSHRSVKSHIPVRRDFVCTFSREWAGFIDCRFDRHTHRTVVSVTQQIFKLVVSTDLEKRYAQVCANLLHGATMST